MSYHCMTKMKNRLLVIILIQLLNKMHSLDAFTNPCNSSVQTVKRVERCPSSGASYKKAAKEKNCSSLAGKALECQSFEYHCVLSDDRKYAIEVCAPSIKIIGSVCAKFSTNLTGIIRIDDFDCTKCPYSYNSTTAFEYSECYANITLPFTTDSSQNSTVTTTSKENDAVIFDVVSTSNPNDEDIFDGVTTSKPNDEDIFDGVTTSKPNDEDMNMDPENKQHEVIAALVSIIGIMSICIVIILIWRKIRRRASKCTEVPEIFRLISNGSHRRPLSQNQHSSTKNDQNEESNLPLISETVTENGLISNGSHATTNRRPLSQNQHSSTKNGIVENKLYNNQDAGMKFAMLNKTLADKFPHQKLQLLKLILQASGKVAEVKSLKDAKTVSGCFALLLDANLYSQYDVVFMQFLCKEMGCKELNEECITYALEHNALCFYENTSDDGHNYLKFHVNADLKYYTKEKIQDIVQVVADILRCKKEDIEIHSLEHSQSFILTLSIKKNYKWKMSDLSAEERQKLVSLDVDFLIVGKETLVLDRSKDNCENKIYNDQDSGIEFAKLTNYLVGSIAADEFQHLKDVILASGKVANVASLNAANSVLDCFHVLLDENLFTQNDVTFMRFLCKHIHSDELYRKCTKYALAHESSCSFENPSGNTLKNGLLNPQKDVQEDTSRCSEELMTKNKETTSDKEEWPPEANRSHRFNWIEDDKVFVETHNFPAMLEKIKSQPFVTFVGVQGSGKTATVRHIALKLQTEEYEILQIQDIEDIETYLKPHPQVFVIDDVLGIFELSTSKLVQLNRYIQYKLKRLKEFNSKILLTCREKVFRNEDVLKADLFKKENVVQMHSPENTLTDEDKQKILAVYDLKITDFTSTLPIAGAFETKTDFTSVFETKSFPKRCEVVSKRKKEMYSNHFSYFYEYLYIERIMDELEEMKARNKVYYALLVLMMANGKELSTDCLKNENNAKCVKKFNDMKSTILKAFGIIDSIENLELITALKEMELIYTKQGDNKFTFLNHLMFEIIACHFGCMFPELMFQYMDSSYIDSHIKLKTLQTQFWKYEETTAKGCEEVMRFEYDKLRGFEKGGYFSMILPEIKYPLLAERLFRNVENGEAVNVFSNDFLKHSLVIKAFIDIMARKSYRHLYSVFFSELTGNANRHFLSSSFAKSGYSFNEHIKRIIHFVIYKDHRHILQHIIERMIKENGNVDDLFSASCKGNTRYLDIKTRDDESEFESVVGYEDHEKSNKSIESKRKHCMEDSNITRESHLELLREQYCLLALACHTRDKKTVHILLSHVDKDILKLFNQLLKPGDFDILKPYFTLLGFACSIGHLEIVEDLIKAGADVNTIDQEKTPLIDACDRGYLKIVGVLVKSGADVNLKVISNTPLTAACNRGHLEIVRVLVKSGADVNLKVISNTPLTTACNRGHLEIVKELVQAGADVNLQNGENAPLTVAYVNNNFKIVQELLKAGAVPNPADKETTPLLAANVMHTLRFVEELIDTRAGQYLSNIEICFKEDNVKENPFLLRAACMKGQLDTVEKLIDAGADVNQSDGSQKPLTAACMWGHLNVIKVMIKAGASVNQSIGKETPLTAACAAGHLNVVQELIKEGADLNRCDDNYTPLTVASFEGHQSIVKALIKAGADVNQKDKDTTPLEAALRNGHLSIVEELRKAGAV